MKESQEKSSTAKKVQKHTKVKQAKKSKPAPTKKILQKSTELQSAIKEVDKQLDKDVELHNASLRSKKFKRASASNKTKSGSRRNKSKTANKSDLKNSSPIERKEKTPERIKLLVRRCQVQPARQPCDECGKPTDRRYSKSSHGPVYICQDCREHVMRYSFPDYDAKAKARKDKHIDVLWLHSTVGGYGTSSKQ